MCPWLGVGLTLTLTRALTARRQGRAQSAPAARKKKQPVRHARSTETGIASPTSRLYLAYSSPTSPQVSSTEEGAFRLRTEGHAAGGASGGAEGTTAKTGGGRAARRRAALRRSSKGGADEGDDDDEPGRKPRKAAQAAQVQKRQRAVSAQQADKIRKLSGR